MFCTRSPFAIHHLLQLEPNGAAGRPVDSMQVLCVFFGVLVVRAWAQVLPAGAPVLPTVTLPPCDSPEAEMAAGVFQDYINAQRTSGFKYSLNQIDEIKITAMVSEN